jgi:hypothetical protein
MAELLVMASGGGSSSSSSSSISYCSIEIWVELIS